MKQKFITVLSIFLSINVAAIAQSVSDGVKDLNAQRYQSAQATFKKLLAANPNDIEATYWLGQTFIEMDDVPAAKALYEKSLMTSANAPLVIVGMGQVELMQNKINEARQRFEAAITMTNGRKGNDPEILNAVGHAIAEVYTDKEKKGDINFAIEKLKEAAEQKIRDDQLLANIYLNLGDAYRKAKPGEAGGDAYQNYQKAIDTKADFPLPYWRMASLFNTQRNWDLYQKYLEQAIDKDPRFAPAYYDLYYYKLGILDFNNAEYYAKKYVETSDPDPQNDYLRVQTLWAKKEYSQAIAGAKNIIVQAGDKTKARVYRLLAYSYRDNKDTAAAKPYIDDFFKKVKNEDINPQDYRLKADIYSVFPGQEEVVFNSFIEGAKADTSLTSALDLLKDATKFFNEKKKYGLEARMFDTLISMKPPGDIIINDLFGATFAYYRDSNYVKSYGYAQQMADKFPDQQFGWDWRYNTATLIDTAKKDSIAVPAAMDLLAFVKGDSVNFSIQMRKASYYLAIYYNEKREFDSAIKYMTVLRSATADVTQKENINGTIHALEEAAKQAKKLQSATGSGGTTSPARKPEG